MKLYPHYGFGDYVICYGLVRELAKESNVVLFVKEHLSELHLDNVRRLYSSIDKVEIVTDDPKPDPDVVYLGWDELFKAVDEGYGLTASEYFYNQLNIPLNLLWDNFYFKRDIEKEKGIYHGIVKGEYVFILDDKSRGFTIRDEYIPKGVQVVRLNEYPNVSVLDCLYLVENAKEVHLSNTGLVSFIDQMGIRHDRLNYHRYTRPATFEQPLLRLNWDIID
jgi:hypothetical protein